MANEAAPPFSAGPRLGDTPSGDGSREAVASLRGYAYQLYASAIAWIDLQPGQQLFLEVAEDYAIAAQDALRAVQVKDTSSSRVTINSQDVLDTLDSFVNLVALNPEREIYVRFLSTSPVGKERAVADRIEGKPVLDYWRRAAVAADIPPLREALGRAKLSENAKRYIDERNDAELRDQLLRRIQWDCGQPPIDVLQTELVDRISRYASDQFRIPLEEGRRLVGVVLLHLLNAIVHAKPRLLTDLDLRKLIEDSTTMRVSRQVGAALMEAAVGQMAGQTAAGTSAILPKSLEAESELPLPPILASRRELVEDVATRIKGQGIAVVTGSSGRGKTVVGRLASRAMAGNWHVADFRNADPSETIRQLDQANAELASSRTDGVILDDLNEADDPVARRALVRFIGAARRRDIACLLIAYNQPSVRALGEMGLDPEICVSVPDLTVQEVAEMVSSAGGDKRWAQTIYMAGGFGHPQLVNAVISGLRSRSWPLDELKALRQFEKSGDVEAERLATRRQLVAAVPDDAKALLYRVSLMIGRFDRATVLSLAALSPPIVAPGEQLDLLLGPWIEQFPQQHLRVSPLLANAGEETLTQPDQEAIHRAVAEAYTSGRSFDVGKVDAAFLHALRGKSEEALNRIAYGIILAEQPIRAKLAEWITGIRLHRTDRPIFAQDARVSFMLRLAQLLLKVHSRDLEDIRKCWEALLRDLDATPAKGRNRLKLLSLGKLLIDPSAAAVLPDWIGLILHLDELIKANKPFARAVRPVVEGIKSPTTGGLMFIVQATGIRNVAELKIVFDRLDGLPEASRRELLGNAASMPSDYALIVNHPWLEEHRENKIDWLANASAYLEMAQKAQRWGIRELALRCYIARGTMLDEYGESPDDALKSLDEAERALGNDPAFSRARAKIHYRRKNHAEALALLRESAGKTATNDHVEQAFMFREAGVSAAETDDWNDAANWFEAAEKEAAQAHTDDMKLMAIGLRADQAMAAFLSKRRPLAFELMAHALNQLSAIDPALSLKAGYVHRVVRHAVLCMNFKSTGKEGFVPDQEAAIAPGMCSNPEPPDITSRPLGHMDFVWYLLAEADIVSGSGAIYQGLKKHIGGRSIPAMEITLRHFLIIDAIKKVDVKLFLDRLPHWLDAVIYLDQNRDAVRNQTMDRPDYGDIPPATSAEIESDRGRFGAVDALLAFGIVAVLSARSEALFDLKCRLKEDAPVASADDLVKAMVGESDVSGFNGLVAAAINNARNAGLQPDDVFAAAVRFVHYLSGSDHKIDLAPVLASWLRARLSHAVAEQRFLLRNPSSTAPAIEDLIKESDSSLAACARLVLVTADAVKTRLSSEYREFLVGLSSAT